MASGKLAMHLRFLLAFQGSGETQHDLGRVIRYLKDRLCDLSWPSALSEPYFIPLVMSGRTAILSVHR